MAQFIFGEALSELGLLVTSAAEAGGISKGSATIAAGATTGFVANKIDTGLTNIATQLIGEQNLNKIEKGFGLVTGIMNDKDRQSAERLKRQQEYLRTHGNFNFNLGQNATTQPVNQSNQSSQPITKFIDFNTEDPRMKSISTDIPTEQELTGKLFSGLINPLTQASPNKPKINTSLIAQFLISHASELASTQVNVINPDNIVQEVVKMNPQLEDVSKTLGSFLSSRIPNNDKYQAIANVYNGKNLTLRNCVTKYDRVTEGLIFTLKDEVGAIVQLKQNKGKVIPALYGIFVGPYSPNNAPPVSLLDLFAAFHDYDYSVNGFFDQIGDYKLISRCSQNYSRMDNSEKPYAKITILYFSTLGHTASSLLGSLPTNIGTVVSDQDTKDDIFPVVSPESISLPPDQYNIARTHFYHDLEDQLELESASSSIMAVYGNNNNKFLSQEFGNINVQLL